MFDELKKYKETDHFFLKPTDSLVKVCNAPESKGDVYIIFALKNGRIELVFIGCSHENEGIRDQIIREQFFLNGKLKQKNIEALDIYWYVTQTSKAINDPGKIKAQVLKTHQGFYGRAPRWNRYN